MAKQVLAFTGPLTPRVGAADVGAGVDVSCQRQAIPESCWAHAILP